jgi:cytochrome oxidase Cu insertion factor (SCO1/SenC/PrrC family)
MSEPVEPLSMTVHRLATPDLASPELAKASQTRRGRLKMLLVLLVCASPVIASYVTYFFIRPNTRTNYSTLILPTRGLPDLSLRNLDGAAVPARSLRGQWLLVSVGPSKCEADCDKRLFMQRQFREVLGKERDRLDKVWFITDEGAVPAPLAAAVKASPAVTALRVDRAALAAWLAPEEGHALEEHLYVVDPMGEWMMRIPAQPEPAKVKRDLERLLRASASWDTPGR